MKIDNANIRNHLKEVQLRKKIETEVKELGTGSFCLFIQLINGTKTVF